MGMLRAGRLSEAEVAARSRACRVARGLSPTAVNLPGVWIERAKYVPRRGTPDAAVQVRACSRAVCKAALLAAPVLILIPQNGLFCACQLRNGEHSRGAPNGGSRAFHRLQLGRERWVRHEDLVPLNRWTAACRPATMGCMPPSWRKVTYLAVGGLTEVGFADGPLLLVVSH
jgi:hypothetical protein